MRQVVERLRVHCRQGESELLSEYSSRWVAQKTGLSLHQKYPHPKRTLRLSVLSSPPSDDFEDEERNGIGASYPGKVNKSRHRLASCTDSILQIAYFSSSGQSPLRNECPTRERSWKRRGRGVDPRAKKMSSHVRRPGRRTASS